MRNMNSWSLTKKISYIKLSSLLKNYIIITKLSSHIIAIRQLIIHILHLIIHILHLIIPSFSTTKVSTHYSSRLLLKQHKLLYLLLRSLIVIALNYCKMMMIKMIEDQSCSFILSIFFQWALFLDWLCAIRAIDGYSMLFFIMEVYSL